MTRPQRRPRRTDGRAGVRAAVYTREMLSTSARGKRCAASLLVTSLLLGTVVTPAAAQDAKELARARAKFQQATELEQAGNCATAVQLFREVGQVRMTPQVRFHIALCEDRLGRLVAALGGYELALADADSVGAEFRAEVEQNVNRLRQSIPKLVIQRGPGADAATIELDGVAVGDSSVGVDIPLDPGPHAVTARAPNYQAFETTVTLAKGERKTVEVALAALAPEVPERPQVVEPPPPPPKQHKIKLAPYIVGGAGVASLLASGVFFALRQSTQAGLDEDCPNSKCPLSKRDDYSRLKTYHYTAWTTGFVGIAAVGAAAVWLITDARREKKEAESVGVVPLLSPEFAGLSAHASF